MGRLWTPPLNRAILEVLNRFCWPCPSSGDNDLRTASLVGAAMRPVPQDPVPQFVTLGFFNSAFYSLRRRLRFVYRDVSGFLRTGPAGRRMAEIDSFESHKPGQPTYLVDTCRQNVGPKPRCTTARPWLAAVAREILVALLHPRVVHTRQRLATQHKHCIAVQADSARAELACSYRHRVVFSQEFPRP